MNDIKTVLDACATITPLDTLITANRKLLQVCHDYCKLHTASDQIILVVSIRGLKPLLYSYSYNFSILNLHDQVSASVRKARRSLCVDIVVLEWLPIQGQKNPYFMHFA